MAIKSLYPSTRASFMQDFANAQVVSPSLSFSRSSVATYVDATGTWQEAAANQPRFHHDAVSGVCNGLLIEPQRTNYILNPRAEGSTSGVVGSGGVLPSDWNLQLALPAGVSQEVVGTGMVDGLPYLDWRIFGTSAGVEFTRIRAATTSRTWTLGEVIACSAGYALVGGSLTNFTNYTLRLNLGAGGTLDVPAPTATPQRGSFISTVASTTTVAAHVQWLFRFTAGAIDATFRLICPTCEYGSYVTTPILPPVGAPAESTRSADILTQSDLLSTEDTDWFNNGAGTWVVFGTTPATAISPLVSMDNTTSDRRMELFSSGTDPDFLVTNVAATQADLDAGTITANTRFKMAAAFAVNDFASCVTGNTVVTDTSGTVPTVTTLRVGSDLAGNQNSGSINRIAYYNTRLTDAQLQSLTK